MVSLVGVALELKRVVETNLIKNKLALYKPFLHLYSHLKQLYISNKTKCFSYKGGCGVCGRTQHIKAFERRAGFGYI